MKKKYFKTAIILSLIATFAFFTCALCPARENLLEKECCGILNHNPGSIIVYDLKEDKLLAVVNPDVAFNHIYSPGSIFKLITATALLETGKVDPSEKINCRNHLKFAGRVYICSKPGGHGMVDMTEAIGLSCSEYFYQKSLMLTPAQLKKYGDIFGINTVAGIPAVNSRMIRGKCDIPKEIGRYILAAVGDCADIKMSPWHAANLTAIIAAGHPISKEIKTPKLKPSTLKVLREGMELAAQKGTCSLLGRMNIDAAAKTGTATNPSDPNRCRGWFISYAPVKEPRYIVVVFLADGKGYTDAVPMGAKILELLQDKDQHLQK